MRLWEKNFLYTLALFTALFYVCIFIVVTTSFSTAISSERDAALREEGLIAESLQNSSSNIGPGGGRELVSRFAPYSTYYKKKGISLALFRSGSKVQGSVPAGAFNLEGGRVCDIFTSDGAKYIRISDELASAPDYTLVYAKDISETYAMLARQSSLLIAVSAAVTFLFAVALFFTLKSIYRPVGSLAHELRTPLTVIRGYAEYILAAAASEEERYSATKYIIDESKRLSDICEKLLIMANLREGEIPFETVDIEALFENAKMTYKNVEYDAQTKTIRGNRALLQSLVNNLVSNAIKAGEPDSVVTVRSYENIIEVTDSGRGMSKAFLSRIYRNGGGSGGDGSSGLGLPLCFQIARLHGAHLSFDSSPGEGTTAQVTFTMP